MSGRFGHKLALNQTRAISTTVPTKAGYWNKDWRPTDEPPTTEEGKRAAAKKYGMIPEDYETYANDGTGYGDYPKLPLISAESRDPHALYDFPELKRNFGEPMHVDFDMVGEDRWDYNKRYRVPMLTMLASFLGVMFGGWGLFCLGEYVRVVPVPMMPRQFPPGSVEYFRDIPLPKVFRQRPHPSVNPGRTNYSFELEDVK